MIDTKEYAALQEECERLRAENQRLHKCLARYRAKYGELSETDKVEEVEPQSAEAIKYIENKVPAPSSNVVLVTNKALRKKKSNFFVRSFADGKIFMQSGGTARKAARAAISPFVITSGIHGFATSGGQSVRNAKTESSPRSTTARSISICRGNLRTERTSSAFIRSLRTSIAGFW